MLVIGYNFKVILMRHAALLLIFFIIVAAVVTISIGFVEFIDFLINVDYLRFKPLTSLLFEFFVAILSVDYRLRWGPKGQDSKSNGSCRCKWTHTGSVTVPCSISVRAGGAQPQRPKVEAAWRRGPAYDWYAHASSALSAKGCKSRSEYPYDRFPRSSAELFCCLWGCLPTTRHREGFLFHVFPSGAIVNALWSFEWFCSLAPQVRQNLATWDTVTASRCDCQRLSHLHPYELARVFSWWGLAWETQPRPRAPPYHCQRLYLTSHL